MLERGTFFFFQLWKRCKQQTTNTGWQKLACRRELLHHGSSATPAPPFFFLAAQVSPNVHKRKFKKLYGQPTIKQKSPQTYERYEQPDSMFLSNNDKFKGKNKTCYMSSVHFGLSAWRADLQVNPTSRWNIWYELLTTVIIYLVTLPPDISSQIGYILWHHPIQLASPSIYIIAHPNGNKFSVFSVSQ